MKNISKNGVGYALFERKLPKAFTNYAGVAPAGLTMICNVTNISYGQIDQSATTATSAKGAVTINFPVLTKRIPAVSADYTFDYDTTETPASWYLNGRKVSLSDYGLSIAWTPQNQDTISLHVVAENPTTTSVLTTQTVKYDVFPSSDLDAEEPTDPTSTEVLQAQVNSITAKIVEMGDELDKKQNKSDSALATTAKNVVTAINELNAELNAPETGIDARVTKNEQDIADLSKEIITGITYIGTMSYEGNEPPTDAQLNAFVKETPGASLAGGDLVIAVQKIPDATDIIYACIYSEGRKTWSVAPIPGLELASDNNAGLIQGGSSDKLYVKIVNGVIQDITANAHSGYPAFSVSNLGSLYRDILYIQSGDITVGRASKAIQDSKGNIIADYYMPNSIGATRNFVRKYALPVEFNDAMYVSANGLVKEVPTTPASGEQFVVNSSSTGYTTLFTVAYNLNNDGGTKFQLSKKNSYNADLFVKAAAQEEVQFVVDLTAGADPTGEGNTTLSTHVTLDTPVATSLTDISVSSLLNELGDNIITLDGSKGNVYIVAKVSVFRTSSTAQTFTVVCNDMYRSAFHLSTAFQTVAISTGKVGELPQMIFTEYAVEGDNVVFTPSMVVPPENSIIHVVLPRLEFWEETKKTVQLSIGGEKVFIQSPNGTSGSGATIDDLYRSLRCYERDVPIEYDFLMSYTDGKYYVQQGYEGSVVSVQFPSGDRTITYDVDNGLSVSATGKIDYYGKTETPQMTVSVPLKAGAGITMAADANSKILEIKNADHDAVANKVDKIVIHNPDGSENTALGLYRTGSASRATYPAHNPQSGVIPLWGGNSNLLGKALPADSDKTTNEYKWTLVNNETFDNALAKKLDKQTASAGTEKLYGVSSTSQTMYTADAENANASTIVKRRADGSILAKATTATDKSGFIYKKSVVNNETLDTAISGKLDKTTINEGAVALYGVSGATQRMYTVAQGAPVPSTIVERGSDGSALFGQGKSLLSAVTLNTIEPIVITPNPSTATSGSVSLNQMSRLLQGLGLHTRPGIIIRKSHLDAEGVVEYDDEYYFPTSGDAETNAYLKYAHESYDGSAFVFKNITVDLSQKTWTLTSDCPVKAATVSATSENSSYVATISNIVATNSDITDVRGRVTALEQKHLYLHCITLTKDPGSDNDGYSISFNVMSAKSGEYASYSAVASDVGNVFETAASGIHVTGISDGNPLHINCIRTASTSQIYANGAEVTTYSIGMVTSTREIDILPSDTFYDTVSTIY